MRPCSTVFDMGYKPLTNTVEVSDFLHAHSSSEHDPYFFNPMRFQLGVFTSLLTHILIVIGFRSEKEMRWPYARWIVTMVQNTFTFRNWTMFKFPRNAMGRFPDTRTDRKFSIAKCRSCAHPNPTGIILSNVRPKSNINWLSPVGVIARVATEVSIMFLGFAWPGKEALATAIAFNWYSAGRRHREPPVFALSGSLWANQRLPLTL